MPPYNCMKYLHVYCRYILHTDVHNLVEAIAAYRLTKVNLGNMHSTASDGTCNVSSSY